MRKETEIFFFFFEHHNCSHCFGCDPHILRHVMDWDPFAAEDAAVLMLEVSMPHGMSSVADSFEE